MEHGLQEGAGQGAGFNISLELWERQFQMAGGSLVASADAPKDNNHMALGEFSLHNPFEGSPEIRHRGGVGNP